MSVESVLQRVATLERALGDPAALLAATGGTAAPAALSDAAPEAASVGGPSFAQALQSASAGYGAASAPSAALATGALAAATAGSPAWTTPAPGTPVSGTPIATSPLPLGSVSGPSADLSSVGELGLATGSAATGSGTGARIVAIAESQLGQAEQPPGSNESPAIAQYRSATVGAIPGAPWCAYFASWAARQAGAPVGAQGEGLGSVSAIWSWAQASGRAIPNGPGVMPRPGDLIVFGGEHVGIVKDVLPDGDIQTVEGNYENKVSLNVRTPTEATGYVNMS